MAAISEEDLRAQFMDGARCIARYWAGLEGKTSLEVAEGVVHSMLCMIDGCSSAFPSAIDLVARPHPDDKQYHIDNDKDWVEDGTVLNDNWSLHEELYKKCSE